MAKSWGMPGYTVNVTSTPSCAAFFASFTVPSAQGSLHALHQGNFSRYASILFISFEIIPLQRTFPWRLPSAPAFYIGPDTCEDTHMRTGRISSRHNFERMASPMQGRFFRQGISLAAFLVACLLFPPVWDACAGPSVAMPAEAAARQQQLFARQKKDAERQRPSAQQARHTANRQRGQAARGGRGAPRKESVHADAWAFGRGHPSKRPRQAPCQPRPKRLSKKGARTPQAGGPGWHGAVSAPVRGYFISDFVLRPRPTARAGVNCYLASDASSRTRATTSKAKISFRMALPSFSACAVPTLLARG